MSYRLGIDLGTTFTAAAVLRDGAEPEAVRLGERGLAAPSVVFLAENGAVLFGEAAEDRVPDAPERIARHFKRRIGDEVPLVLGSTSDDGTSRRTEAFAHDLYAAMIAWVVATVTGREGAGPDAIAVTHPASWNRRKLDLLMAALEAQTLPPVTLITEPEAAAAGYARTAAIPHPATFAVYDLGGGTLDVALLDTTADGRFTRRGTPAGLEGLGGIDFDDAVLGHVLTAVDAASWAGIDADQMDPQILRSLAELRTAGVEAKERLSTETETSVSVSVDGTLLTVPLKRSDFDGLIEGMVDRSVEFFHAVVAAAGLEIEQLSAVLLTGGSVQVPLVTHMLSEDLPAQVRILRAVDPKSMVAAGAALSLQPALGSAGRCAGVVPAARASVGSVSASTPALPHARDGAAADQTVPFAAIAVAQAAPMPTAAPPAPVPTPVRAAVPAARRQERTSAEMPARPAGHSFFDEPTEDDVFELAPAGRRRRASFLRRLAVLVVLGGAVAAAVTYWPKETAPATESATTQITHGADVVTDAVTDVVRGEVKGASKPRNEPAPAPADQGAADAPAGN